MKGKSLRDSLQRQVALDKLISEELELVVGSIGPIFEAILASQCFPIQYNQRQIVHYSQLRFGPER